MTLTNTNGQDISQAPGSIVPTNTTLTVSPASSSTTATTTQSNSLVTPSVSSTDPVDVSALGGSSSFTLPPAVPAPSIYDVSSLPTASSAFTLTPTETQAQGLTGNIQDLNTQDAGKAAFTADQYAKLGYAVSTDENGNIVASDPALNDLNTQLTTLQNEAQAIPIQEQQNATGRGMTDAGLAPIQSADLRNNAIKALTVSSLIAARQGKMATAKMMVDNAVTQKYGPIEAELKAAQNNLDALMNSPQLSLEEKQQAQEQQIALNTQAAQIDLAKTNYTNVQNEVLKYAGVADAATLNAMSQAETPQQVAEIAASKGLVQPQSGRYQQTTSTLTDAFGNQYQVSHIFDTLTGKYVNAPGGASAASLNASDANGGSAGPFPAPATTPSSITSGGAQGSLSVNQYGLLAKTNFNPGNTVDALAQRYLDAYIKSGTVPTSSVLGRNIKPGAMAAIDTRARDLYYQATGTALPNPEIIKGYQSLVNTNNTLLNTLQTQEGTISANFGLNLQNITSNDINATGPTTLNNFIDTLKNWAGDPNVAQYMLQNATIANEFGSILALRNAQGTTVHDKLESSGLLPSGASVTQQKQLLQTLLKEAQNAKTSLSSVNANLYKQIDPLMQDPNNPLRQQQANAQFVEKTLSSQGINYDSLMAEMTPKAPAGTQPALDAKTGQIGYATADEIAAGTAIPL